MASNEPKSVSARTDVREQEEQRAFLYARIRKRLDDRKKAREVARDQERNFLEYRKIQILYEFKPTSKALARPAEDVFPRRKFNFKDMAFGARKAHFLSLRPNRQFADWHGKKKEEDNQAKDNELTAKFKSAIIPMAPVEKLASSKGVVASAVNDIAGGIHKGDLEAIDQQIKHLDKISRENECCPSALLSSLFPPPTTDGTEPPLDTERKKGERPLSGPLASTAFWLAKKDDDNDTTDEDAPIDADKLGEVISGTYKLVPARYKRTTFNPYAKLDFFRRADKLLFEGIYLSGNTLYSVMVLFPDKGNDGVAKAPKQKKEAKTPVDHNNKKEITWAETIDEYVGTGAYARMKGTGVKDGPLAKSILPFVVHVRDKN